MAAITTPEQAKTITGADVTVEQIATATGIVEAVTGVDLSAEPLPFVRRDLRHLRNAVAWQARYMLDPEAAAAVDRPGNLASANANGVSVAWTGGSAEAILAPLARMALRRLSWRGSRSVRMVAGSATPTLGAPQTLVSDGSDGAWKPLR